MSPSLNSLKVSISEIIQGTAIGVTKGDTRSLDYGSYRLVQDFVHQRLLKVSGRGHLKHHD